MILLIDNYDSFTFNLQRYLIQLGQDVTVMRNDVPGLQENLSRDYSAIVISPGPRRPQDAGYCLDVVREYSGRLPILGICLGHQVVFEAFGGTIGNAAKPTHGKLAAMELLPSRLFDGSDKGTLFARYHSLVGLAGTTPRWLRVIAWSPDGELMAVEHIEHLTFGVQFHPESVLSLSGHQVLRNFLICAGLPRIASLPRIDLESPNQVQPSRLPVVRDSTAVVLPSGWADIEH